MKKPFFVGLVVIVGIIIVLLVINNIQLRQEIFLLYRNNTNLQVENVGLKDEIKSLGTELENQKSKYEELNKEYNTKKLQLEDIKLKLKDFEKGIQEKLSSFAKNSDFRNMPKEYGYLRNGIALTKENECKIHLPKIVYENDANFKLFYQEDTGETELKSLNDIFDDYGGDCDDYSLLFMAEYNALMNSCINSGFDRNEVIVEGMTSNYGVYIIQEYGGSYIYYTGAPTYISNGGNYMYGVCYPETERVGHCVVGLFSKSIKSEEEISQLLDGVPLVEPQSGVYLGNINEYIDKEDVQILITDTDVYMLEENKWMGYGTFLKEVKEYIEGGFYTESSKLSLECVSLCGGIEGYSWYDFDFGENKCVCYDKDDNIIKSTYL
ncbi:MAG: hypothetical protein Q8O03_04220 [Nanoarchaeota archaeon]|nr:hypothetical protein [Nanoarchaeota archaeon]